MKITTDSAKTVQVDHPEASYAIFCFNSIGDLFINSDWGFYAYSWRSFGQRTFEEFLSECNSDYLLKKLEITQSGNGGKIYQNQKKNLVILIDEFINVLKEECKKTVTQNS